MKKSVLGIAAAAALIAGGVSLAAKPAAAQSNCFWNGTYWECGVAPAPGMFYSYPDYWNAYPGPFEYYPGPSMPYPGPRPSGH